MNITIALPLPPRTLSPNARTHYFAKAKATKMYRRMAAVIAVSASCNDRPQWAQATAQATFYFAQNRNRDKDNLLASLKAAFDGIADAGVVADDSGITHLPVLIAIDKANPRVEITVSKAGAA